MTWFAVFALGYALCAWLDRQARRRRRDRAERRALRSSAERAARG